MGEYAKTYETIERLKKEKAKRLKKIARLEKWIATTREQVEEINQEIGECEGYLLELDYIDNGGSKGL